MLDERMMCDLHDYGNTACEYSKWSHKLLIYSRVDKLKEFTDPLPKCTCSYKEVEPFPKNEKPSWFRRFFSFLLTDEERCRLSADMNMNNYHLEEDHLKSHVSRYGEKFCKRCGEHFWYPHRYGNW